MVEILKIYCPLCSEIGKDFYQHKQQNYYQCENCYGIFMAEDKKPSTEVELARYKKHENDVNDKNYQAFVSPITSAIMRDFNQNSSGLDFGAGNGPVISKILLEKEFKIRQYDPFFHNDPELLKNQYDYIACCEVIEHFHNPNREFELLKNLLKPKGKLFCMTSLYDETIDFHNWSYKNDITHVFVFQEETIHWVKEEFDFSDVIIEDRLITYSN